VIVEKFRPRTMIRIEHPCPMRQIESIIHSDCVNVQYQFSMLVDVHKKMNIDR